MRMGPKTPASCTDTSAARRCAGLPEGNHPKPQPQRSASQPAKARHSRLPVDETKEQRLRFKDDAIGYVHIDSCELRHVDGKLVMFLAIDRVSKFSYAEFKDSAGKMEGAAFLEAVVEAFPHRIHTVLTDNDMAFADLPKNRDGASRRGSARTSSIASRSPTASSIG